MKTSCKKDDKIVETPIPVDNRGVIFNPDLTYGAVSDNDGNTYKTIVIGTQTWMAENLRTTKYRNGDLIGTTIPATLNIDGDSTPKYQWIYGDNIHVLDFYGRLYTWYTINDSRDVCPSDWHIPSDSEWTVLVNYLGGYVVAGNALKETTNRHWLTLPSNELPTNSSGFSAIPGGVRFYDGTFENSIQTGSWWSSDIDTFFNDKSIGRTLVYDTSLVYTFHAFKKMGLSVRCVKD
jgi:uncharacterized protein (TIGR02145 family)